MRPSFANLFKRGKYYHRIAPLTESSDEATPEQTRERKELERFIVAAIAFCFQHEPMFRKSFFKTISQLDNDPDLEDWTVDVEPHSWGDMVVRNRSSCGRFVYAIECKIGADLDLHQNPDLPQFTEPGGYATLLGRAENEAKLRYTVLGYRKTLRLPRKFPKLRLETQQRFWAHVATRCSQTEKIVSDLFDSLGDLGIPEFSYKHTDNMKIEATAIDAAKAGQVITHVADKLELLSDYGFVDPWFRSPEEWCFGYVIKKLPPRHGKSPNQRLLMSTLNSNADEIAWFGYEPHGKRRSKLSVYLYCGDETTARRIKRKLDGDYKQVVVKDHEDGGLVDVILTVYEHNKANDRDWFLGVFTALGLKVKDQI